MSTVSSLLNHTITSRLSNLEVTNNQAFAALSVRIDQDVSVDLYALEANLEAEAAGDTNPDRDISLAVFEDLELTGNEVFANLLLANEGKLIYYAQRTAEQRVTDLSRIFNLPIRLRKVGGHVVVAGMMGTVIGTAVVRLSTVGEFVGAGEKPFPYRFR